MSELEKFLLQNRKNWRGALMLTKRISVLENEELPNSYTLRTAECGVSKSYTGIIIRHAPLRLFRVVCRPIDVESLQKKLFFADINLTNCIFLHVNAKSVDVKVFYDQGYWRLGYQDKTINCKNENELLAILKVKSFEQFNELFLPAQVDANKLYTYCFKIETNVRSESFLTYICARKNSFKDTDFLEIVPSFNSKLNIRVPKRYVFDSYEFLLDTFLKEKSPLNWPVFDNLSKTFIGHLHK